MSPSIPGQLFAMTRWPARSKRSTQCSQLSAVIHSPWISTIVWGREDWDAMTGPPLRAVAPLAIDDSPLPCGTTSTQSPSLAELAFLHVSIAPVTVGGTRRKALRADDCNAASTKSGAPLHNP